MAITDIHAGQDIQAALDAAQPGDTLRIESQATWAQDLLFREKSGPVTVTCDDALLPGEGNRVTEDQSKGYPFLRGNHKTSPRGSYWTVRGLRFGSYENTYTTGLLDLTGSGINGDIVVNTEADLPRDWVVDRCWLEGDANYGGKRGIAMSANFRVVDSVIKTIWSDFQDSQALAAWNSPGPFHIENCTLEGSGENVMFGGAAPAIPNLVPSDIVIEHCWIYKPLAWCPWGSTGQRNFRRYRLEKRNGQWAWTRGAEAAKVKNQLEFKSGCRAIIRYNVFENCWASAQAGYGILFTVRTCEAGDYPWACIADIEFSHNYVLSQNGLNYMGCDEQRQNCGGVPPVAGKVERIKVTDNVISANWLFQIMSGTCDVEIARNTCDDNYSGQFMNFASNPNSRPMQNLSVRNNRFRYGYGMGGDSAGPGMQALNQYWGSSWVFAENAIHGIPESELWWVNDYSGWYPPGNLYVADISQVPEGYGCDMAALQSELAHVRDGQRGGSTPAPSQAMLVVNTPLAPGEYDLTPHGAVRRGFARGAGS